MKIYYAHCIAIYNTPQELRDIGTLTALGFEIVNPNHPGASEAYRQHGMDYFVRLVEDCQALSFRALPDGRIPAGVLMEIEVARHAGKAIIELPSNQSGRTMSVEATREYLSEIGQR